MRAELPLATAVLQLRSGRPGDAVKDAAKAVAVYQKERGDPFDEGRAREVFGEALIAAGRRDDGSKEMAKATSSYGRIGARNAASRCSKRSR